MGYLPFLIGGDSIGSISRTTAHIGGSYVVEPHVAGEVAEVVHYAVDTKVVAVNLILVSRITAVLSRDSVQ